MDSQSILQIISSFLFRTGTVSHCGGVKRDATPGKIAYMSTLHFGSRLTLREALITPNARINMATGCVKWRRRSSESCSRGQIYFCTATRQADKQHARTSGPNSASL